MAIEVNRRYLPPRRRHVILAWRGKLLRALVERAAFASCSRPALSGRFAAPRHGDRAPWLQHLRNRHSLPQNPVKLLLTDEKFLARETGTILVLVVGF
jgi:hypothetical protein